RICHTQKNRSPKLLVPKCLRVLPGTFPYTVAAFSTFPEQTSASLTGFGIEEHWWLSIQAIVTALQI
ncbi:hypothetical protein OFB92_35510, partial [Escherichia coli]|nr:hypothetical protein [Escherichia coli]